MSSIFHCSPSEIPPYVIGSRVRLVSILDQSQYNRQLGRLLGPLGEDEKVEHWAVELESSSSSSSSSSSPVKIIKCSSKYFENVGKDEQRKCLLTVLQVGDLRPSVWHALLATGCDVDAPYEDMQGGTLLFFAAFAGNAEACKLLIDVGADANASNKSGWTAIMFAANEGHVSALETIVNGGGDVSARNDDGWNAVLLAAKGGKDKALEMLLKKGADKSTISDFKKNAYDLAMEGGHDRVVKILKRHGVGPTMDIIQASMTHLLAVDDTNKRAERFRRRSFATTGVSSNADDAKTKTATATATAAKTRETPLQQQGPTDAQTDLHKKLKALLPLVDEESLYYILCLADNKSTLEHIAKELQEQNLGDRGPQRARVIKCIESSRAAELKASSLSPPQADAAGSTSSPSSAFLSTVFNGVVSSLLPPIIRSPSSVSGSPASTSGDSPSAAAAGVSPTAEGPRKSLDQRLAAVDRRNVSPLVKAGQASLSPLQQAKQGGSSGGGAASSNAGTNLGFLDSSPFAGGASSSSSSPEPLSPDNSADPKHQFVSALADLGKASRKVRGAPENFAAAARREQAERDMSLPHIRSQRELERLKLPEDERRIDRRLDKEEFFEASRRRRSF